MRLFVASVLLLLSCSATAAGQRLIKACSNCTPATLARTQATLIEEGDEPLDVYVIVASNWSVSRFQVTKAIEWVNGEDRIKISVVAKTPDPGVLSQIQDGIYRAKPIVEKGVSWYEMDWGGANPVHSAHEVARDEGAAAMLQGAIERTIQRDVLGMASRTVLDTIEGIFGGAVGSQLTILFPDGTVVSVMLVELRIDADTGKAVYRAEVRRSTAMDGQPIPITRESMERYVNWSGLNSERTERFYGTALHYGLQTLIHGSGRSLSCTWDGKTLHCTRHNPL